MIVEENWVRLRDVSLAPCRLECPLQLGTYTQESEDILLLCSVCQSPHTVTMGKEIWLTQKISRTAFRCSMCGSCFFHPRLTEAELSECYTGGYRAGYIQNHHKNLARGYVLGRSLSKFSGVHKRFLDVGCSIGSMMQGVQASSGWDVYGMEFASDAVEICRRRSLEVIDCSLVSQTRWEPGFFGYILANNVLEHEVDPAAVFAAMVRLLAPGGILHLVVPNGPCDIAPSLALASEGRATTMSEGHVVFFHQKGIRRLAQVNGLEVLSAAPFHVSANLKKRGFWPGIAKKWRKKLILHPLPPASCGPQAIGQDENAISIDVLRSVPSRRQIGAAIWAHWEKAMQSFLPLDCGGDWEWKMRKPL